MDLALCDLCKGRDNYVESTISEVFSFLWRFKFNGLILLQVRL